MATMPIRDLLILLGVVGVMGMPYMTLMPVFAAHVHGSGADTLGIMYGAVGLGALMGALFLAQRKNIIGLGRMIVFATLGFGVGLIFYSVPGVLAFTAVSGRRGLRLDGVDRCEQYRATNAVR